MSSAPGKSRARYLPFPFRIVSLYLLIAVLLSGSKTGSPAGEPVGFAAFFGVLPGAATGLSAAAPALGGGFTSSASAGAARSDTASATSRRRGRGSISPSVPEPRAAKPLARPGGRRDKGTCPRRPTPRAFGRFRGTRWRPRRA